MEKQNNQKGFAAFEIVLIVVALLAVGTAGYFAYQSRQAQTDYSVNTPTKPSSSKKAKDTSGTIAGQASYPGEGLPPDEQVCAVNTNGGAPTCVNVGNGSDLNYTLKVATGKYFVYSTAEKEMPGYKAYYNQFSKCGNSTACPEEGHNQNIEVNVTAGSTTNGIDPSDWYKQ